MILLVHMLFGAAIASYIKNPFLAVSLAFLSHYLLDFIPHTEYNIENIKKRQWNKSLPDVLKLAFDFFSGIMLILLLSNPSAGSGQAIIFIAAFFAILPDGLTVLGYFFQIRYLELHKKFHQKKIHFLKDNPSAGSGQRKISGFWRVANQALIIIISVLLFLF